MVKTRLCLSIYTLVEISFLKAADTQTHVCAKCSTTCSKCWLLNAKLYYLFEPDLTDFNALFLCFMAFPAGFHAPFFLAGHFTCAMKIAFRKSVFILLPLDGTFSEHDEH